jgi:hypothetical protein
VGTRKPLWVRVLAYAVIVPLTFVGIYVAIRWGASMVIDTVGRNR